MFLKLNIKKIVLIFAVMTSCTVISANIISFFNFDPYAIEAHTDFDGCMEFDEIDSVEDGDSMFSGEIISHPNSLMGIFLGQYLLFDHFIPGINSPPPELV